MKRCFRIVLGYTNLLFFFVFHYKSCCRFSQQMLRGDMSLNLVKCWAKFSCSRRTKEEKNMSLIPSWPRYSTLPYRERTNHPLSRYSTDKETKIRKKIYNNTGTHTQSTTTVCAIGHELHTFNIYSTHITGTKRCNHITPQIMEYRILYRLTQG